eukprot:CAMPEP_0195066274 /NCGR_PEP_ID=MMETSP0448-20130528/11670_1 /TAXON_ID=66468 /ORGANISM="Heterocapsa triquestra, Strain CCMP 448" /LENGTH=66 /DNA_ID=CAMNT_0040097495 /DNA_START=360 /DNA_END=560 /DNA_ORIENTATION=+
MALHKALLWAPALNSCVVALTTVTEKGSLVPMAIVVSLAPACAHPGASCKGPDASRFPAPPVNPSV